MYLEELTGAIQLENTDIECKVKLDRKNVQGWLKTICGFSNADGGIMFLGVEDKTNKLIGYSREDADHERNYLNNQINEHVTPRPQYSIAFLRYEVRGSERFIVKVDVSESAYKPVILRYDGIPAIYMRRQGFTNGATLEEIIDMSRNSKEIKYDLLPTDIPYHRESFSQLHQFCKERNDGNDILTEKALASMGFFTEDGKLANGALLFIDDYSGGKTEVHCSVYSGFSRGSERIVSLNTFNGNLIESIRYMQEYVLQRMNHTIIKLPDSRRNVDAFPRRALFEGIVNAVAHRDYELKGTQVQVDIFRDRLEITSPGGFYQHEKIRKTYDLSSLISKRRNELICNVLVRCNAMEASGTGFEKIEEDYENEDMLHKPFIRSESDHFVLVLPDLTYDEGVQSDDLPRLAFPPVPNGTKHDQKVLEFCYDRARTAMEIAKYLELSNSSYLRSRILKNLTENGYLEEDAVSGTSYYKTARGLVQMI